MEANGIGATARPIARDRRWRTVLATTPRGARTDWTHFVPRGTPRLDQPKGDLGARMAGCMKRYPRAVLAGSDIPDLRPDDIAAAILGHLRAALEEIEAVADELAETEEVEA
mgnify:CR=1 FL=1